MPPPAFWVDQAPMHMAAVLLHVWIASAAVGAVLARARRLFALLHDAETALREMCSGAEGIATSFMNIPHTLAARLSDTTRANTEVLVHTVGRFVTFLWVERVGACPLTGSIQGVEFGVNLLCNSYKSFFLCTLQLVVQGVLALLDTATHALSDVVHDASQALRSALIALADGVESALGIAVDSTNTVLGLFGQHIDAPSWDEQSMLRIPDNVTLPASLQEPFHELRAHIPTVDQLRSASEDTLDRTLEQLRADVQLHMVDFRFPPKQANDPPAFAVKLCPSMRWDVFLHASDALALATRRAVAIVGIVLVISVAVSCALLYGASLGRRSPGAAEELPSAYWVRVRRVLRWWLSTTTLQLLAIALAVRVAVAGLLLHGLSFMRKAIDDALGDALEVAWDPTVQALNDAMARTTLHYVEGTNAQLLATQRDLNQLVAGWLGRAVPEITAALDAVLDVLSGTVDDVLGGTPLHAPAAQYVACLLGNKLHRVESALAWAQSNARVELPLLPESNVATTSEFARLLSGSAVRFGIVRHMAQFLDYEADKLREECATLGLLFAASAIAVVGAAMLLAACLPPRREEKEVPM
ncbi:plasma membrane fusion protein prm1 [Malassezia sp. CBS 17886]|nr:plasma membrane fusion protein prm1 [Malassezia sp. CBS 17886]